MQQGIENSLVFLIQDNNIHTYVYIHTLKSIIIKKFVGFQKPL